MSPRLVRIAEALKEFYSALATVLRLPVIFGLMAATIAYGVRVTIYVGFQFGLIQAVAFFLFIKSVLIYYVIRRIREGQRIEDTEGRMGGKNRYRQSNRRIHETD